MVHRIDETESVTVAVVGAVAEAVGCDPLEVESLYESVDPEAVESLFETTPSGTNRTGTVTFSVHNCLVTLIDGDRVRVEPVTSA